MWTDRLARKAELRERAGLRRELRPRPAGDDLIDLAGNDYLGLSRHPAVVEAAAKALMSYGLGATGSRLVRGSTDLHAELEARLAAWLGCEAALVYSSGYLANLGAVRALAHNGVRILSDAHNHASLVDGVRAAGTEKEIYPHADLDAVTATVRRQDLIVTESVFSVDGDLAPVAAIAEVAREHDALLLVDDAHGVGVVGPAGAGGVAAAGVAGRPEVVVTATLSKAFGAAGGVVAGPSVLIRHLVDTGRTFIFDTALPPAVAAGALAALDLLSGPVGEAARAGLRARASLAVQRLRAAGLSVSDPAGGVLSVRAPGPTEAVAWAAACREKGVAVGCFRPPSTPDTVSRLRLTVNMGVPDGDFRRALDVVEAAAP